MLYQKQRDDTGLCHICTTSIFMPASVYLDDFRQEVFNKHRKLVGPMNLYQINVFKQEQLSRSSNLVNEQPLEPAETLGSLGSRDDMLVVVVPSSRSSSRSSSEPVRGGKEPNPDRKQRWIELNAILEGNTKKSKTNDSTAYSCVTWSQVKSVFNPTNYVQERRSIDDVKLSFLAEYLSITTRCFGDITTGKEAKRLHFIAPVLICVCILFKGDVDIVVEEDLVGTFVKAHGHFEFMLRRGNKAVCIVEAKKDDVEQGMAQDLVGCEVAAEVGGLEIVDGIVTNYIQWNFLRSLNNKVEKEECSLRLTPHGPDRESLKEIAEKIYAMLSNE